MLMKMKPYLEPFAGLRAAVPSQLRQTLDLVIGTITPPLDQPNCATAIGTIFACIILYGDSLPFTRSEFQSLLEEVKEIAEIVKEQSIAIQGTPPSGQMRKRKTDYPVWSLLLELPPEAMPLRVALGSEGVRALLERTQINEKYCTAIRKDISKYGRPEVGDERLTQDLADVHFGRGWLAHFNRVDREVRRMVELPDPNGPTRPDSAKPRHQLDILAVLRWRFEYPNPKHRQASLDDSHLPQAQFSRAVYEVRQRVEQGDAGAVVCAVSLLNRLAPELVLSLPLVTPDLRLNYVGLDIARGAMVLDLNALFPNARRPPPGTATLFHQSDRVLTVPLPTFLANSLRERWAQHSDAQLLGDLLGWVKVDHTQSLVTCETCKLKSSLARASKSTGAMAIATGVDRLMAAALTWDFSLIGSARMYYGLLTGKSIHTCSSMLFKSMDWGEPDLEASQIPAAGSMSVLTQDGVKQIFGYLEQQCTDSWPARRCSLDRLLTHHDHYTRYSVALMAFCLGLRPVKAYRLLAQDLLSGQALITIHDKQGSDPLMAQPTSLNALVLEQIRQYVSHCQSLIQRLEKQEISQGTTLAATLNSTLEGQGFLFLFRSSRGAPRPAGASTVWGVLPAHLRVPGNVGRHFWQNFLRTQGLSSRDVDRFMRHRIVALENNTNSQSASPHQSYQRIQDAQVQVLQAMGISVVSGLRRA